MARRIDVTLPRAIEDQERRAEELHRQIYGNPSETDATGQQQQSAAPGVTGQPPNPPAAPPPKAPENPAPPTEDAAYWKNRFDVMEGKYKAEVPRFAEQVRQLNAQLATLQQQVEEAKKAPQPQATVPEDLVKKYGEEFVQDIRKLVPPTVDDGLVKRVENAERVATKTAQEKFMDFLDANAPQWRQLNEDPGFLTWLAGMDEFSGQSRMQLFDNAAAMLDAPRVAVFFNRFSKGGTVQSEERHADPPPTPAPQAQEVIVPDTTRSSPTPKGKKIWTKAEINAFYRDVRTGVVKTDEAAAIERDIFAAQREGRIR